MLVEKGNGLAPKNRCPCGTIRLCGFDRPTVDRGIIRMCSRCRVPVCRSCQMLLRQADGKSNVPMALANDNWYGYVHKVVVE